MSFQSTFLREGNWVTETVTVQDALRHSSAKKTVMLDDSLPSPTCGLLTRTLVESPIVRWVMPVRLRSNSHRDIAFIGVSTNLTYGCEAMFVANSYHNLEDRIP